MRLLVITQKVDKDDSYFGFFHEWIAYFAKECKEVIVITVECRTYDLPENVRVYSLGKEHDSSRASRVLLFWKYIWSLRDSYDVVFCHMSPLYVITGFPVWKIFKKKISLWYVHRSVDAKLRLAEKLSDVIFTSSPESFRIPSKKLYFMRQAVPVNVFKNPNKQFSNNQTPRIVSVGRLTPIKNLEVLITAAHILTTQSIAIRISLIGSPLIDFDQKYTNRLKELVRNLGLKDIVSFEGSVPFERIRERYWESVASVNLAPTGGMDKVVLESIAAGTCAFVANKAFLPLLKGYEDRFIFTEDDAQELASKIEAFLEATDQSEMAKILQQRVQNEYSLQSLISNIVRILKTSHETSI